MEYYQLLEDYLHSENELALYKALEMGKKCVEIEIGPEDIVGIHLEAIKQIQHVGLEYGTDEEILALNFLLEIMVAYGISHKEFLSLKLRELQLKKELEIAREIQQGLLPQKIPEINGLAIGIETVPAKEMAGDYYDVFNVRENLLGIAIADVSGKSIPAALILPTLKYALRSQSIITGNVVETVKQVNIFMHENMTSSMFISMIYALYDCNKQLLTYVRAGHEPGIVWREKQRKVESLEKEGIVLGVDPTYGFQQESLELSTGDIVILYTDGILESKSEKGMYGYERLVETICKHHDLSAPKLANKIKMEAINFANLDLYDDMTVMVLKVV